jgi:hypothetical protein
MNRSTRRFALLSAAGSVALSASMGGQAVSSVPAFSNEVLRAPATSLPPGFSTSPPGQSGDSEPAISFGTDGTMAVDGLGWLPFQVNAWTGHFGSSPTYFGAMDTQLQNKGAGRRTLGDEDADVEVTSAGTLVLADLDLVLNGNNFQLGVSVTRCPRGSTGPASCTTAFLDTAGADREWLTVRGTTLWIAYHDSKNSSLIRTKRSDDDGRTWKAAGSPVVGQGQTTGGATFNNSIGPLAADPHSAYVYESFITGTPQSKCCSSDFNQVFVARSNDGGEHYATSRVFAAPAGTRLNNFWPALAVDKVTGRVWTAWTDQHGMWASSSGDHGVTWSAPVLVSTATTTVMPWVAAQGGKVDVVYYGTSAASTDDQTAVWNTYDSQLLGGTWSVKTVSNSPNRVGAVCLNGSACAGNKDRELLDLFEVAQDPATGKAAVIYTDTTLDTWTDPQGGVHELPEIVLAFEQ